MIIKETKRYKLVVNKDEVFVFDKETKKKTSPLIGINGGMFAKKLKKMNNTHFNNNCEKLTFI